MDLLSKRKVRCKKCGNIFHTGVVQPRCNGVNKETHRICSSRDVEWLEEVKRTENIRDLKRRIGDYLVE